ncbi:MAG: GIY-YIG nuclease family protein [Acidobacteriaceae bacterium]
MSTSCVYALVDPNTHLVRYVGQTQELEQRYALHCSASGGCTAEWVQSLVPLKPVLVLLAEVEHPDFDNYPVTEAETKWIKRFRRTILNVRTRQNSPSTWDRLTNPDERA